MSRYSIYLGLILTDPLLGSRCQNWAADLQRPQRDGSRQAQLSECLEGCPALHHPGGGFL